MNTPIRGQSCLFAKEDKRKECVLYDSCQLLVWIIWIVVIKLNNTMYALS